jgi:NADH-quinone oxidoreductase subunit J
MIGSLYFAFCALTSLVGSLITILARSPIRGAVGLLMTIFGIAGLFLKLDAQFMAAIQLIVYAGAVVVLFVFVIMLLGASATSTPMSDGQAKFARSAGAILMGLSALGGILLIAGSAETGTEFPVVSEAYGSAQAVAARLFSETIVPFELTSALLIVAIVGAIAVAKGKQEGRRATPAARGVGKFFHGPVTERDDVGRPVPSPDASVSSSSSSATSVTSAGTTSEGA